MITRRSSRCPSASLRRGLTLVEMAVSVVLVGVMLVAALNTVGASKLGQRKLYGRRQGHQLAQDLMAEILQQDYADAAAGPDSFGVEGDEVGDGSRALWDDVDDYDGWSATPPQRKDGTVTADLDGWARAVSVEWVGATDISQIVGSNEGAKRVTVTVSHDDVPVAELVALRTIGPPSTEACCLGDGTCVNMAPDVCTTLGGEPQGAGTNCFTNSCARGPTLLLVVTDDTNPTTQELARQTLIESWDFQVTLISASASQSDFDAAVAEANVVYVCEEINAADLDTKLRDAAIGVVNEEPDLIGQFGFGGNGLSKSRNEIDIIDNGHYITSPFGTGLLTYLSSLQTVGVISGGEAPGLNALATLLNTGSQWKPGLAVIDVSGGLYYGGTAAGRRVQLPWAYSVFDFNSLNTDGQTIMQRAIEWAAGLDGGGGGECGEIYVNDIAMSSRKSGKKYIGQATVWIKADGGADVAGATVTVQWSGAVSGSAQGVTGADGKVMLESPGKRGGGTFMCTVTDVVRSGCTYNASLNVETTDAITAP